MRVALDTDVLAYAEGVNGAARKKAALDIVEKLPEDSTFLPVQVLGELFHVLVRKAGRSPERARAAILSWQDAFPLIETSPAVILAASDLATPPSVRHLGRGSLRCCRCGGMPVATIGRLAGGWPTRFTSTQHPMRLGGWPTCFCVRSTNAIKRLAD